MGTQTRCYLEGVETVPRTDELRIRQLTFDEWLGLPDEDEGEWVDGWLVEEEVGSGQHGLAVGWLTARLGAWAFPRGGAVFGSDVKLAIGEGRGRKPDLSVFLSYRQLLGDDRALRHPPDIVVEVVSPAPRDQRRDRIAKFAEYASFGARYYWILDPQARTLEIFERTPEGRYLRAAAASEGTVDVPGCEGLVIELSVLWTELDRWFPQG